MKQRPKPNPFVGLLILCLIPVVLALTVLPLQAVENPFLGRWALTLPDGRAGWLGVEQKGDSLAASVLWGGGSVLPAPFAGSGIRRNPKNCSSPIS